MSRSVAWGLVGIRRGQCSRGNRIKAIVEMGGAGMRDAVRVGSGRTHQERHRTGADRRGRAVAAKPAAIAVVMAIAEFLHPVIDECDLARERTGGQVVGA